MRTCALVAASDFNAEHFRALDERGMFEEAVAVDAGFAHLEAIGRVPDIALGDFDSLGYVPACERVVQHPVRKDKSDMELAFDYAESCGFETVYVYGALGGRLDHTLANLQLIALFAEKGMNITAVGETFAVHPMAGPATFDLPVLTEGIVSVFAATDVANGVTERGLVYPLEDAELTNRTSLGLSNEYDGSGGPATVAVEEGTLLVFYPLKDGVASC